MGFRQGAFAKIWELNDKGNYHEARATISKKNKETDKYDQEWSSFVRLVGKAHNQAKTLDISKNVKIGSCDVTNKYVKEKNETYTNYVIFEFENADSNTGESTNANNKPKSDGFMSIPDGVEEELPFN